MISPCAFHRRQAARRAFSAETLLRPLAAKKQSRVAHSAHISCATYISRHFQSIATGIAPQPGQQATTAMPNHALQRTAPAVMVAAPSRQTHRGSYHASLRRR